MQDEITEQQAREAVMRIWRTADAATEVSVETAVSMYGSGNAEIAAERARQDWVLAVTWAEQELSRRDAERAERSLPITAEWCETLCDEVVRYDGLGWTWMLDSDAEEDVRLVMWDDFSCGIWWRDRDAKEDWNPVPLTWNVAKRGQLLDLLAALKGGAS